MALNNEELIKFKNSILQASDTLASNELVYLSECIFDLPGHDLKINGISILDDKYEISKGWNGFGYKDLEKLVKEGFLLKIYESEQDPITLERQVIYKITKSI